MLADAYCPCRRSRVCVSAVWVHSQGLAFGVMMPRRGSPEHDDVTLQQTAAQQTRKQATNRSTADIIVRNDEQGEQDKKKKLLGRIARWGAMATSVLIS